MAVPEARNFHESFNAHPSSPFDQIDPVADLINRTVSRLNGTAIDDHSDSENSEHNNVYTRSQALSPSPLPLPLFLPSLPSSPIPCSPIPQVGGGGKFIHPQIMEIRSQPLESAVAPTASVFFASVAGPIAPDPVPV